MDRRIIHTVGHSTHTLDFFLELLQSAGINGIVDVRSVPASAYHPQYNQASLKDFPSQNRIRYLHFADEFGAMKSDGDLLNEEGKLDFEKVRKTRMFQQGLERIWQGVEKGRRK